MIIYNNFIPFEGFVAINLFGIIFVRGDKVDQTTLTHEDIHTAQMKEMLYIFFYLWYILEWLVKLYKFKDFKLAYKNISFEREAKTYERNPYYLSLFRKKYAWLDML